MSSAPPLLQPGDALFLDFDGTLVEIAARPDLVTVPAGLIARLRALHGALGGALAIVTGRALAGVDQFLGALLLPAAGLHGAELRKANGEFQTVAEPSRMREAVAALRNQFESAPGVLVEDKGLSVALHYRNAPALAPDCGRAMAALAAQLELHLMHGKQVIEARATPATKADGIAALMQLPEFRGRKPVFAGDDVTDEDGFRSMKELGGYGIKVGEGATTADYRLADVPALWAWLEACEQALAAAPPVRPSPSLDTRPSVRPE